MLTKEEYKLWKKFKICLPDMVSPMEFFSDLRKNKIVYYIEFLNSDLEKIIKMHQKNYIDLYFTDKKEIFEKDHKIWFILLPLGLDALQNYKQNLYNKKIQYYMIGATIASALGAFASALATWLK